MNIRRGTTLIEILLYLGVLSVVLLAVSAFLGLASVTRVKARSMIEVDQAGGIVMQAMTQAVRNATAVRDPVRGSTVGRLEVEGAAPGGGITVFDLSDGVIRISEDGGDPVALTDGRQTISLFTVSEVAGEETPSAVHIQFTVLRTVIPGRNEYQYERTFSGTAVLRTGL